MSVSIVVYLDSRSQLQGRHLIQSLQAQGVAAQVMIYYPSGSDAPADLPEGYRAEALSAGEGPAAAFARGLAAADQDFIACFQTPALLRPQHLSLCLQALAQGGDAVATRPGFVDNELLPIPEASLPALQPQDWPGFSLGSRLLWPLESFVFRRAALTAETFAGLSEQPSAGDLLPWLMQHQVEVLPQTSLELPLTPFWLADSPAFRQAQVKALIQGYSPEQLTPSYAVSGAKSDYLCYQSICQALRNQGLWQYLEAFQQKHIKATLSTRNVLWLVHEDLEPWQPWLKALIAQGIYPTVVLASERPGFSSGYQTLYEQREDLAVITISGLPASEPGNQPSGLIPIVTSIYHSLRPERVHLTSFERFSFYLPAALEPTNTPIYYSLGDDSLLRPRKLLRAPESLKGQPELLDQQNRQAERFLRDQAAAVLVHDAAGEAALREAGFGPGSYRRLDAPQDLAALYGRLPVLPYQPVGHDSLALLYESRSGEPLAGALLRDAARLRAHGRTLAFGDSVEPFVANLLEAKVWVQGVMTRPERVSQGVETALPLRTGRPDQLSNQIHGFDLLYTPYVLETLRLRELRQLLTSAVLSLRKGGTWALRLLNPALLANDGFWLSEQTLRPYPLPLVKRLLTQAGFEVTQSETESEGWQDLLVEAELRTTALPLLNMPLASEALEAYWDAHPPSITLGENDRVLLLGPHIFKTWMMYRVQCEDMLAITTDVSELGKRQKRSNKFRFRHSRDPIRTLSLLKSRFDTIMLQALPETLSPIELEQLLRLCREHLNEGGKLSIQTLQLAPDQAEPLFWQSLAHVRPYPDLGPLLQEHGFSVQHREQRDQHLVYECSLSEPAAAPRPTPALPAAVKAVMQQARSVMSLESPQDLQKLQPQSQACILADDLLERIPPQLLPQALARIVSALEPDGAFVLSFAPAQDWKWTESKGFRPYPEALVDKLLAEAGLQKRSLVRHNHRWVWCGFRRLSYQASPAAGVRLRWEGDALNYHSLAAVNRALLKQLLPEPGYEIEIRNFSDPVFRPEPGDPDYALLQAMFRPLSGPPQLTVRHHWPPDFSLPQSPGHWVMIQPWEFGALPERWIYNMNKFVDQVWVPSEYVRQSYLRSGLLAEKVAVVPNGVDPELYSPEAPALVLPTKKRFKFLFVGGGILRKGVDLLLNAFVETFSADEDVCLVLKEFGAGKVYQTIEIGEWIERYRSNHPNMPEIVHLVEDLPPEQMPALYNSADCLVHPFRGEGFALPIAEAMACERAVLVTSYGPTLEYCDDGNAYLIPAQEVPFKEKQIDDTLVTVDYPYWAEPDYDALKALLRHIYENPEEARRKARKARATIVENLTWRHSLLQMEAQIEIVKQRPVYRFYREQLLASLLGQAFAAVEAQRYAEAAETFEQALQVDPYQPSVSYNLGVAYLMLERYGEALEALTRSLREGEVTADLCYAMGTVLRHLGDYPTSQEFFAKARELDPSLFAV